MEPLTATLTRLHVTVSRRLLEKLASARDALSHSNPTASDDAILELGLDLIIDRHRKRRGIGAKPRKNAAKAPAGPVAPAPAASPRLSPFASPGERLGEQPAPAASPSERGAPTSPTARQGEGSDLWRPLRRGRSRHVPADVWRAVWERDGGRCAYPLENGGVCGSTWRLQLDHVDGFALGAGTTVRECRIACACHNDVNARRLYGDDLMNRYTRPRRGPRRAEPLAAYAAGLRAAGAPSGSRHGTKRLRAGRDHGTPGPRDVR